MIINVSLEEFIEQIETRTVGLTWSKIIEELKMYHGQHIHKGKGLLGTLGLSLIVAKKNGVADLTFEEALLKEKIRLGAVEEMYDVWKLGSVYSI